jgi:hypothetical protein
VIITREEQILLEPYASDLFLILGYDRAMSVMEVFFKVFILGKRAGNTE